jgi:hypothetical protein
MTMEKGYPVAAGLPSDLDDFRSKYRSRAVGRYYNGFVHLAFVTLGALAVICLALSSVRGPTWLDWLCLPVTFVLANFVEYLGHRGPMHRHFRWMGLMFQRHTREHHRFFTDQGMTCRSQKDFKIVLFPPLLLFFYLGVVAFPIGSVLLLFRTWNTACFYVAMATFYFLSYEMLHFCYHLDDAAWVSSLPFIGALRRHHRIHHRLDLMLKYNFNITWPIADYLFGTIYRNEPTLEVVNGGTANDKSGSIHSQSRDTSIPTPASHEVER